MDKPALFGTDKSFDSTSVNSRSQMKILESDSSRTLGLGLASWQN